MKIKQSIIRDNDFNVLELSESDSNGNMLLKLKYDLKGRITHKTDELGNWWDITYDRGEMLIMKYETRKFNDKRVFSFRSYYSNDELKVYIESNIEDWDAILKDLKPFF